MGINRTWQCMNRLVRPADFADLWEMSDDIGTWPGSAWVTDFVKPQAGVVLGESCVKSP